MQDSVVAVFDMSPELILVPRAFIILVSVGDRSPTLTKTIEALGTRMESRAQRNDKRIHGYVRTKQQNFIFILQFCHTDEITVAGKSPRSRAYEE